MKKIIFFILILTVVACKSSTTPELYKVVDTVKHRLDKTEVKVETMSLAFSSLTKSQITQINGLIATAITTATAPLSAQIKALQDTLKIYKTQGSSDFSKNASGQMIISPAGVLRIKPLIKAP